MKKITYAILLTALITLISGFNTNNLEADLQPSEPETFNLQSVSKTQTDPMSAPYGPAASPFSGMIILIVAGIAGFFFVKKHQDLAKKHQNVINKH